MPSFMSILMALFTTIYELFLDHWYSFNLRFRSNHHSCVMLNGFILLGFCQLRKTKSPVSAHKFKFIRHSLQGFITVLIGYYDYHPMTKWPEIGSCDYSQMSF